MFNPVSASLALGCFVVSLLGLALECLLLTDFLRRGASARRVLHTAYHLLVLLFLLSWAMFSALAAVSLTLDTLSLTVLRWGLFLLCPVGVFAALLEHEWLEAVPAVCAFFVLPFFEYALASGFPVILLLMLLLLTAQRVLCLVRAVRGASQQLSLASIQEALDALDDGILFADAKGRILLSSQIMEALSFSICRTPLRSADAFWEGLSAFTQTDLVTKVTVGDSFLFRFAGGNTWTFHRETLTAGRREYRQIVALNVTESDNVRRQLLAKTTEKERLSAQIAEATALTGEIHAAEDAAIRSTENFGSVAKTMAALSRFLTEHYALPADSFDFRRLADSTRSILSSFAQVSCPLSESEEAPAEESLPEETVSEDTPPEEAPPEPETETPDEAAEPEADE